MATLLGNFLLWFSLFFATFQFITVRRTAKKTRLLTIAVNGLLLSSSLSFALLMYAYIVSDFSVLNVYQNSHTTKPLLYKITGVWGNHEGSMLLWILVLTIFNYLIYRLNNKENFIFISKTLETQAIISIGFILFTLLTSNPFIKIAPVENGLGFNPILQDPALAIHPPLLYMGYVGLSAAFSMGIATLFMSANKKIAWYNYMKPFVIIAWAFLTIGIALGSVWAYYELGWGGWWFWDPVENASFMPWLLSTALLHSLIIVEKRKSLQVWVLLLSLLAFLLSVIGTFLVRSGILTSVHTFALDPSRGIYILTFITLLGAYSLILFVIKSKKYFDNNYFSFFSKEGAILFNNIIMIVVCSTVLLGTIYPLLIEAFTNSKISVGEPYYNSTVIPIMIPAILIMGVGPILGWGEENKIKTLKKILPDIFVTLFLTAIIFFVYKSYSLIGVTGIILAFWIISNNIHLLIKKNKRYSSGMIVAHLGVGLLILGITGSSIWQKEKIIKMQINQETQIQNYKIVFNKIKEIKKQNFLAIQGNFLVYDNNKNVITKLQPENRYYPVTKNFTTEASIHTNLLRDLYIVLGEGNLDEGWVVRIYYNPLVIWIWIGAIVIFLGGIISFNVNLKKIKT